MRIVKRARIAFLFLIVGIVISMCLSYKRRIVIKDWLYVQQDVGIDATTSLAALIGKYEYCMDRGSMVCLFSKSRNVDLDIKRVYELYEKMLNTHKEHCKEEPCNLCNKILVEDMINKYNLCRNLYAARDISRCQEKAVELLNMLKIIYSNTEVSVKSDIGNIVNWIYRDIIFEFMSIIIIFAAWHLTIERMCVCGGSNAKKSSPSC